MAAPLAVCTKEEQRAVIRFLWSEGVPEAEIHRKFSTQYGDSALPLRSVYEWIEKFKSGRTNVTHEEGAGLPSTSTTDEKIQQAREMVGQTGELPSMRYHVLYRLVMVLPIKSSTMS